MELQTAKGTRDFSPEEQMLRNKLLDKLKTIFELYGFVPLETPILERYETLSAKYAGGEEILKETFKLTDQGGRELGLRYDLTVPLARYIGMNPNLKLPFKRYQFGEVFRDGPIKLGRYREFTQCDIDVIGSSSMLADAELLDIVLEFFKGLKLPVVIEVNNRKILDGLMAVYGITESKDKLSIILSMDKLKKIGLQNVLAELKSKNFDKEFRLRELITQLNKKGTNKEKLSRLKRLSQSNNLLKTGLQEMQKLLSSSKKLVFEPSLARGLSYYTGTIFEVFAKKSELTSSLAAGGRYDKLIENYIGRSYPAVGISFGIEPIFEIFKKTIKQKTNTRVYVIPIKTEKQCTAIVKILREANINTEVDIIGRGISKNLDYASSMGIPFVLFAGEKELKQKKVKLRDMNSGKEQMLALKSAIKKLT